ncbi:Mitochondrial carrier protein LEU5 [Penicillium chermesinum]|uniref:Mitochondrial thiamine pyrophosphate carrier 1 n=1 Tax=Penicillium chermesinum TaxID=63820 RepID=A0A9W9P7A2_9EURO|nr:Mitochondrial carrier protein LEU5 [Penicillium chermesinum]KAJ5239223.1 Mitochondrial carrier protein LEU5 [Penicillium chermesinum]
MSTAPADHAQLDPLSLKQTYTSSHSGADLPSPHIPQMSGIAHPRSSDPITGGAGTRVVTNINAEEKKKNEGAVKPMKTRSLDYVLRSGLAGGLAGCAGKTVVAPLDRVKILFQASNPQFAKYTGSWAGFAAAIRDIKRDEGARGLFKGHSATLLRIFPYAAIKFLAYEQIRAIVIPSHDKETPIRRLVSGSMAGITSVFFTYPLELIRVRLAFETKASSRSSLSDICRQIYFEHTTPPSTGAAAAGNPPSTASAAAETVSATVNKAVPRSGIANFYRGFGPTILGMLPYAGISFLTHDTVGDWLRLPALSQYTTIKGSEAKYSVQNSKRLQLTAAAELFSGAVAGLVSQTASYPLEVIRRRMQVGGAVGDGHRLGFTETARKIFLERGFRGFFVGLTIGYMKIIPMSATSFFVYERVKWSLGI